MTKTKTTKRALIASVLSLLVCFSMLIGSTFAWFTDTASTGVNKIQAGTLDIAFMVKDSTSETGWTDAEDYGTLEFKNVAESSDILWEPGATFALPTVKLVNNGNLALKFNMVINGVYGDLELADVLDVWMKVGNASEWTKTGLTLSQFMADPDGAAHGVILPTGSEETDLAKDTTVGASAEYTIALHMQETAGNKYQGMSLGGMTFTAFASQYTYENDMTGKDYDKDALGVQEQNVIDLVAAGYTKVQSYDELKTAITENKNVVLAANITTSGTSNELVIAANADVTIDLNGYTVTHTTTASGNSNNLIRVSGDAKLTVNDSALIGGMVANVNSSNSGFATVIWSEGTTVINGGNLVLNCSGSAWGYVVDLRPNAWGTAYSSAASLTVNDGVLNAGGEEAVRVAYNSDTKHETKNVTFNMNGGTLVGYSAVFVQQLNSEYEELNVNVNGGTLDTTTYVFRIYSSEGNAGANTYNDGLSGAVNKVTIGNDVVLTGEGSAVYYVKTPDATNSIVGCNGLTVTKK